MRVGIEFLSNTCAFSLSTPRPFCFLVPRDRSPARKKLPAVRARHSPPRPRAARLTGVAPHVVRYYARIGLLKLRHHPHNGYKLFGSGDLKRLRFVRMAHDLGFTLAEVRKILRDGDRGEIACPRARYRAPTNRRAPPRNQCAPGATAPPRGRGCSMGTDAGRRSGRRQHLSFNRIGRGKTELTP